MSNFSFLQERFPLLAKLGDFAELYCFSDPNSSILKSGMINESIVNLVFTYDSIPLPYENTAVNRINTLSREGMITRDICDIMHALRKSRNDASHENYDDPAKAKVLLEMAYSLCEWFMQTYGDWSYESRPFVMPVEGQHVSVSEEQKAQQEQEEKDLQTKAEKAAAAAPSVDKKKRQQQSQKASSHRYKSEEETRYLIDEQLRQVGWEADTQTLRYGKGTRPEKDRNIAIAEWPTDSTVGNSGRADYALFVGEKMVATVEAKAMHKDIPSVIDYQCKEYSKLIKAEHSQYQISTWGDYKVPFTFATNGRPYLEQLDTKSGIWFLDLRENYNAPKALRGWISPAGMMEMLEKDIEAGNRQLLALPYDDLRDKEGLNLRDYQIKAIQAAEKAIMDGQQYVLLAMATGTGKTRTVLGMIYRFLKTDRFKRILFLVDRTSLGDQAEETFDEVKLEDLKTLDNIYTITGLNDEGVEDTTRVHIATVQSMVKRLLYNSEDQKPAVTDYDLVIIDEAHRGYILDKEMGEEEILFRDQMDYQSKYRSVIEYFDAVRIALTATPALQTTEIFGKPVFSYTYREAVIDGYLVDHDVPHDLHTHLRDDGIHYKKYVLDNSFIIQRYRPEVYLMTEAEIHCFFKECDQYVLRKKVPGRAYVLPALYRFMYCCGVRSAEARQLKCQDVHLDKGYVDILWAKAHRDRRLFLSEELTQYLIDYDAAIRKVFPEREYFFPGGRGEICSSTALSANFRNIWLSAGLKRDGKVKPRAYDFRHHFACANIMRWASEGKDIHAMLPYLMRYMGHSSLESTYYYIHLIPDFFPQYHGMTASTEELIPEVDADEV